MKDDDIPNRDDNPINEIKFTRATFFEILKLCTENQDGYSHTIISLEDHADVKEYINEFCKEIADTESARECCNRTLTSENCVMFPSIAELPAAGEVEHSCLFIASKQANETSLYKMPTQSLKGGSISHHYFYLQNCNSAKLYSMAITIVFRGDFEGTEYIPGELDVKLTNGDRPIQTKKNSNRVSMLEIGHVNPEDRVPSTLEQLGRLVLRHEPKSEVIESGLFGLSIKANASSKYSISISGLFACDAFSEVKREIGRMKATHRESLSLSVNSRALDTSIRLIERKLRIAEDRLVKEAQAQCDRCENEIEKLDMELDFRDELDDNGAFLIEKLKVKEVEYIHWRSLRSRRLNARDELKSQLKNLIHEKSLTNQKSSLLSKELNANKPKLSAAASFLWGHEKSASIMAQFDNRSSENIR
mmetsp:Transcript_15268/g.32426  ORF Transcript_15268/g.32426 Transcript_15268/m.32426 type:complete len:419 (-) Transcript_15268:1634-2890(-)